MGIVRGVLGVEQVCPNSEHKSSNDARSGLVDFDKVNASALSALSRLLEEWFPAGKWDGDEFRCGDWAGNPGTSFAINRKTGKGGDFAGDDFAGDPVGIYARRFGLDRVDAAHELADRLGLGDGAYLSAYEARRHGARAQLPAVREEAPPPADPEKLAKVEEILGQCVPLKGTPGQAYLLSRGITGAPGFKWQPRAGGKPGGYLVAVGTDDTGKPMCVQRIAITGEGTKNKSAQVEKRTNGHAKGNPVRIPPAKGREDDPLLLTEGPEDALTLRLATGLEVWACLSVSNMGHAPVPAGRHVIVCRDNDAPDSDADKALAKALCHLLDRGITPACARPPAGVKDANDLLRAFAVPEEGLSAVQAMVNGAQVVERPVVADEPEPNSAPSPEDGKVVSIEAGRRRRKRPVSDDGEDGPDWAAILSTNRDGDFRANLSNAIHIFRHHPAWAGCLAFDEMALSVTLLKAPPFGWPGQQACPRAWTDDDDRRATEWLQRAWPGIPTASIELVGNAIQTVARETPFHPVRAYLEGLTWDGRERLSDWITDHCNAPDNGYTAAVGRKWMIAAVARVMKPGCKVDTVLVLEGDQGLGKSAVFDALAGEWFSDDVGELGTRDAAMQTAAAWVIELAELAALGRAEVERIKAFITRRVDRIRLPYGKRIEAFPRQSVFAATTNRRDYLKDETGNRRFWPVEVFGPFNLEGLRRSRDQLWAEAVHAYRAGEQWHLTEPALLAAAEQEQRERCASDPWDDDVRTFVALRQWVTVAEVLGECLKLEKSRMGQAEQNRVARILRQLGFERRQIPYSVNRARPWAYVREGVELRQLHQFDGDGVVQ